MAYYRASMDAKVANWQKINVIIKAKDATDAIRKAEAFDFEDISLEEVYDTEVVAYDKCEGIVLEKII